MIRVEGFEKEYVLDLNEIDGRETELLVVSKENDGVRHSLWGVDTKSSDNIIAEVVGNNTVYVSADTTYICDEEYFWLVNTNKDKYKVRILPSKKVIDEKIYDFEVKCNEDYEGESQTEKMLNITSNVNGEELEWECTHNGFPLDFDVIPNKGKGNAEVLVYPTSEINGEANGFFEFTQEESGITVRLKFSVNDDKLTFKD